jgi:Inhibitor of growth proteins N-terminal histone-binding
MSGDETYLEAFVDHLSTLPQEVRRNMDLVKDLDKTVR